MPGPTPFTGLAGLAASPGTIMPDEFQRISSSPADFGAGVGQAEQGLGQGLNQVGQNVQQIIDLHNKTAADDATNQMMSYGRTLMYGDPNDPNSKGLTQLQGADALAAYPKMQALLQQQQSAIAATLNDPMAKHAFDQDSRRYMSILQDRMGEYTVGQSRVYAEQTSQNTVNNHLANAALAPDQAGWEQEVGSAQATRANFLTSTGASQDTITAAKRGIFDTAADTRIRDTSLTNVSGAQQMLTQMRPSLDPKTALALDAYLAPKVRNLQINGLADDALGAASTNTPLPAGPLVGKITTAANAQGISPGLALTTASIESGIALNAGTPSGPYGPFQMTPGTWAARGGTAANRSDPDAMVSLGVANIVHSQQVAQQALGSKPPDWASYLVHQQGNAGGAALLSANPNLPAAQVLAPAYGGNLATATMAIVANGGQAGSTVGQFLGHWQQTYAAKQVTPPDQPAGKPYQVAANLPGQPVASDVPAALPPGARPPLAHADEAFPPDAQPGTAPPTPTPDSPHDTPAAAQGTTQGGAQAAPAPPPPGTPSTPSRPVPQLTQADYLRNNEVAILDGVRAKAAAMFPGDPGAADLAVARTQQRIGAIVQQQDAHYKADSYLVYQAVNGDLAKGNAPSTIDQMTATSSAVAAAWDRMQTQQPQVAHEVATRLLSANAKLNSGDAKTLGPLFYDTFKAIHAPDGDPTKLTDPNQLNSLLGNGLTVEGLAKARAEMAGKATADGEAEGAMRSQFFKNARGEISGTDDGLGLRDPKGDEQFLRFQAQAYPAIAAAKAEGKSPAQIYNPDSPDYVGKLIPGFRRSLAQRSADMMAASGNAAPAAPSAADKPGFFGRLFGSSPPPDLNDPATIRSQVASGMMTRDEAVARLTGKFRAPQTAPSAPGAQPMAQPDIPFPAGP